MHRFCADEASASRKNPVTQVVSNLISRKRTRGGWLKVAPFIVPHH
jgi:hypothetical protein